MSASDTIVPMQPSDIKGDVALELDADLVTAEDFVSCTEAFLSLLKEITAKLHKPLRQDCWYISVQEGSQVINAARNHSRITQAIAGEIIYVMVHGFRFPRRERRFLMSSRKRLSSMHEG